MQNVLRRISLFASISRLHIIAIAVLGCFTFGWVLTGQYLFLLSAVCGLDWFLVNLLNRVVDLPEDRINQIDGTDFVERNQRGIRWFGFSLLFASLVVGWFWSPELTPWRVGYHLLGLAYNWPLLPGKRRIKQLYFWKNSASAIGFLITLFAYPLAHHGFGGPWAEGVSGITIAVAISFFFMFELSYEVIYDLRDLEGDRSAGIRTYPAVHGSEVSVWIIDGLIVGSALLLTAGYLLGEVPWRLMIMVCAPLIQLVYYKLALKRGLTKADCIRLTWLGAVLLLTYHIWWSLGLPGTELG